MDDSLLESFSQLQKIRGKIHENSRPIRNSANKRGILVQLKLKIKYFHALGCGKITAVDLLTLSKL